MKGILVVTAFGLMASSACKNESTPPPPSAAAPSAPEVVVAKAASQAVYERSETSCSGIISGLSDGMSKEGVTPGSWGDAPKELQVIPPGGELCGAASYRNSPVIRSRLFGDELGAFYKPIILAMGCTFEGVIRILPAGPAAAARVSERGGARRTRGEHLGRSG